MQEKKEDFSPWQYNGVEKCRRRRRSVLPGSIKKYKGAGEDGEVFSLAVLRIIKVQEKKVECSPWQYKGVYRFRRRRRIVLPGSIKEYKGAGEEEEVFSMPV